MRRLEKFLDKRLEKLSDRQLKVLEIITFILIVAILSFLVFTW